MIITISVDGACSPNPGAGGWACVFRIPSTAKAIYGSERASTNNRMELTATIKALEHLSRGCEIILNSDSQYVIEGITKWIHVWHKKNWNGVKNKDLWLKLEAAAKRHTITWTWIKGHSTHGDNNICDELANKAAKKQLSGKLILK